MLQPAPPSTKLDVNNSSKQYTCIKGTQVYQRIVNEWEVNSKLLVNQ